MDQHPPVKPLVQPRGSSAMLERHADGLTLKIPAQGVVRGGGFLLWWTVPWNLFTIPMAVVVWYQAFSGAPVFDDKPATFLWYLFPLPFLFAGAVTGMIVLHIGWRRAAFAVVGDRLSVMHVGLFGTRRGEWTRDQLAAIGLGPSGIEENDTPVLELQIHPHQGAKFSLFAKRNVAELTWIAAVLRHELNLPAEPESVVPTPDAEEKVGEQDLLAPGKPAAGASSYSWIGAGIGVGTAVTVLWFIVNHSWDVRGVPGLVWLGWPWSKFYLWSAGGTVLGCLGGLVYLAGQRRHARAIAELCATMGFTYAPVAFQPEFRDFATLRLFKKWSSASNRMSGQLQGLRVEILDYTFVEKGSDDSSYYSQTVLLLPAVEGGLPAFELRPRHLGMKMLGMLGVGGLTFRPDDTPSDADREAVERFNLQYHLSEGLEGLVEKMGKKIAARAEGGDEPEAGQGEEKPAAETELDRGEEAIRRQFTLDVLRFFAGRPGWYVESDGTHLALWRRSTIVRAVDRPGFLEDGLEVRRTLTRPAASAGLVAASPVLSGLEPARLTARLAGTLLGLFAGFFTGGILGSGVAMDQVPGQGRFAGRALLFFGGLLLGLVVGGVAGNRLLYYPIYLFVKARHARRRPPNA